MRSADFMTEPFAMKAIRPAAEKAEYAAPEKFTMAVPERKPSEAERLHNADVEQLDTDVEQWRAALIPEEPKGHTVKELAAMFDMPETTVRRKLAILVSQGKLLRRPNSQGVFLYRFPEADDA